MNTNRFTIGLAIFLWALNFGQVTAQTGKAQVTSNMNQDSVAFHQSLMNQSGAIAASANNSGGLQLMAATSSATNYSGSFTVGGNASIFYPVVFDDNGWDYHEATMLNLGRSNVYENGEWHGTMIANIKFHTTNWGHGAEFIDTDIKQYNGYGWKAFIAGWQDATISNGLRQIIIWLRGQTTYFYHCNYPQNPVFTNGSLTVGNSTYQVKTQVDTYVNSYGPTFSGNIAVSGNIGIGTGTPTHKLDVRGTVRANEVLVNSGGADFVFAPDYRLRSLSEVEQFITANKRLPDIAPADSMVQNGVNMGEMQIRLLQKIEELTLYVIEQEKRINTQQKEIEELKSSRQGRNIGRKSSSPHWKSPVRDGISRQ